MIADLHPFWPGIIALVLWLATSAAIIYGIERKR